MSDSGDSDDGWISYKDRPEWSDVTPVPEDEGSHQIVVIAHSDKFVDVYDYFRAVIQVNEKSERALQLTKDAAELNPANYTVWQYRREILKALEKDLNAELEYVEQVIRGCSKNYQVWHHRRVLVEWLQDPSHELEITGDALMQDPKNYHAWQHRQWAIKQFGLFQKEMDFVESLLRDDVRNNSAWNERYFVVNNHMGWSDLNVQIEICFTMEKIKFIKNNESAWNYLRGVLKHDKRGISGNRVVSSFCEGLYKDRCRSPYLLSFIIDICDAAVKKGEVNCLHSATRAVALCEALAGKYDKMRSKYWNYVCQKFKKAAAEEEFGKDAAEAAEEEMGKDAAEAAGEAIGKDAAEAAGEAIGKDAAEAAWEAIGKDAVKAAGEEIGKDAAKAAGEEIGNDAAEAADEAIGKDAAEAAKEEIRKDAAECMDE